ncbi:GDP-fucose protein O-fucosyltransferase protein [Actinidia chinensis var. chinensis]|uniref:O-fucosyltransferase family protein n=1 Tax=Actinidia chinensis var. chinensis TaxID=1590841 RepID=A0A2R6RP63_ACTCC|nr:GDP-fucose protein O-fucosyltransferase protein [Actinidia chinensis var. chinensis]
MHGYSPLGRPSPSSPRRIRHGCFKNASVGGVGSFRGGDAKLQRFVERLVYVFISAVYRRRGVLLFAPLLYISGMLLYMGSLGFDVVVVSKVTGGGGKPAPPGSVYRSPQVFEKLWPFMEAENNASSSNTLMHVWNPKLRQGWKPCINHSSSQAELAKSNGFLIIEANGGLNQQRLSICDAVAVAGLLNATLVIPIFHLNSVWRDSSKFGDIFDEEFFIYALRNHVNVVRELPEDILQRFDHNISSIVNLRVKAWSSPTYYLQKVLPKLVEMGAVRIAPFSNRLAHAVPLNIQLIRCLANFEALRFSETIRILAAKMVDRMLKNSTKSGGKYISVHLRFEEDMVAFSCCEYDGGEEEKREMDIARERSWRGKFHRRGRIIRPGAIRMDGKCPLTPLEVGMMLRGMGFDNNTAVYVAAGKIYKAEKYMAPLKQIFPLLETKDTLASPEELAPFQGHSSRLAALDYTVCLHSGVFVTTQGGNFPHFLMGHRRYLYGGHAKTIKPDKRKLALLFDSPKLRWENIKHQLQDMLRHSDIKGNELRKPSGSLYTYPMPDCMCKQHSDVGNEDGNAG